MICHIYVAIYICSYLYFTLDKDRTTYPDLLHYLQDVDDWNTLGACILPANSIGQLSVFDRTHKGDVRECRREVIVEYMRNGNRSWSTVTDALIKMRNTNLAEDIKRKLGL